MDDDETETLFGAPRRRNEPTHVLAALDDDVDPVSYTHLTLPTICSV